MNGPFKEGRRSCLLYLKVIILIFAQIKASFGKRDISAT